MTKDKPRKPSRFLFDLNEYYTARKRHNTSFSNVPCPQNFIPGATKAKMPNVRLTKTTSRKISSVCFQGVLVRIKENMTTIEKGLIPAGLLTLGVPTPSQHTSCLEHELDRIHKSNHRKTMASLDDIGEATEFNDIPEEEDCRLLEMGRMQQRGFSVPVTCGDVRMLPMEDHALADLCSDHKLRRSSFPLNKDEYMEYLPCVYHEHSHPELDSATRLGAICKNLSNEPSCNNLDSNSESSSAEVLVDSSIRDTCSTSFNVMVPAKKCLIKRDSFVKQGSNNTRSELVIPEIKFQREVVPTPLAENGSLIEGRSSGEARGDDKKLKKNSGRKEKDTLQVFKVKSLRRKFNSRRKKQKEASATNTEPTDEDRKETFSQIQNALRSKLPKTFQTTVRMGLSFDPITVKERNNRGRNCDNLTSMLQGRQRSKSGGAAQLFIPKSRRSKTMGNIFATPSLLVSPPEQKGAGERQDDKGGVFDTIRSRLGRRRSMNSTDSNNIKQKDLLIVPLQCPDMDTDGSFELQPTHVNKLEKLLGPEFGKVYYNSVSHRSRSLPLIRKNGKKFADETGHLGHAKSSSQLDVRHSSRPELRGLFLDSSPNTSDTSSCPSISESDADADVSDLDASDGVVDEAQSGNEENGTRSTIENNCKYHLSKAVVFLARESEQCPISNGVDGETGLGRQNTSQKLDNSRSINHCGSTSGKESHQLDRTNIASRNEIVSREKGMFLSQDKAQVENMEIRPFSPTQSIANGVHNTPKKMADDVGSVNIETVTKWNIINKPSSYINAQFISLKKSKSLKTTQELIEDSKISRERSSSLKDRKIEEKNNGVALIRRVEEKRKNLQRNNDADENNNADANSDAIAELDALLQELETYDSF